MRILKSIICDKKEVFSHWWLNFYKVENNPLRYYFDCSYRVVQYSHVHFYFFALFKLFCFFKVEHTLKIKQLNYKLIFSEGARQRQLVKKSLGIYYPQFSHLIKLIEYKTNMWSDRSSFWSIFSLFFLCFRSKILLTPNQIMI